MEAGRQDEIVPTNLIHTSLLRRKKVAKNLGYLKKTAQRKQWHNGRKILRIHVDNIMIISLKGSNFLPPISHCQFLPPNFDNTLLHPFIFLGSLSILYILLYRPLFFSNILGLIPFGLNKGYRSRSPCHHFHIHQESQHPENKDLEVSYPEYQIQVSRIIPCRDP
jgi:hypothetical protein